MENNRLYVVSIYTENQIGLLSSITNTFTRRSLDIESLEAFPTDFKGIHRLAIRTRTREEKIIPVIKQLEKKVEIIKAFYYVDEEILLKEHNAVAAFLSERDKAHEAETENDK